MSNHQAWASRKSLARFRTKSSDGAFDRSNSQSCIAIANTSTRISILQLPPRTIYPRSYPSELPSHYLQAFSSIRYLQNQPCEPLPLPPRKSFRGENLRNPRTQGPPLYIEPRFFKWIW